jgi:hypothetical protein
VENFSAGPFLLKLYKILMFDKSDNVINFLNTKCCKILLSDPHDTIINDSASLKTGISRRAINHLLKNKLEGMNKSILGDIMNHNELQNFKESLINLFNCNSALNKTESSSKIFEMQTLLKKEIKISSEGKDYVRLDSPTKNFETISNTDIATSPEEDNTKYFNSVKLVSKEIISIMEEFESAGDSLATICEIKGKKEKEMFIENFFNNLLIWGCIKSDRDESDKIMSHEEIFVKF